MSFFGIQIGIEKLIFTIQRSYYKEFGGKRMQNLWNQEVESSFFESSMRRFASPEQLFYPTDDNRFVAY